MLPLKEPVPDLDAAIGAGPAPGRSLRVVSVDDSGDGRVVVNLEGDDGAVAQLPMDSEEAAEYPEGASVMLSCSPGGETEGGETMDADDGDRPINEAAGMPPLPRGVQRYNERERIRGKIRESKKPKEEIA